MKTLLTGLLVCTVGLVSAQSTEDYDQAKNQLFMNAAELNGAPKWKSSSEITYASQGADYIYNLKTGKSKKVEKEEKKKSSRTPSSTSPDGLWDIKIKEGNLFLVNTETKEEKQLTDDAEENYGYATDNAGWTHSDKAIVLWSPDSKKIATYRQDQRHVSDMYLVKTTVGAPELMAWKYPLPEDKDIIKIERLVIDVQSGKMVKFDRPSEDRRSTLGDDISSRGVLIDAYWSSDSKNLAFVSTPRDHKSAEVQIADVNTGVVKSLFKEEIETQFESGMDGVSWRYLSDSNEILWFSERDNYGHLYLYDAKTGDLKNQITKGNFVVRSIEFIDTKKREIYFTGSSLDTEVNPYYHYLYKVDFKGKNIKLLSPGLGDHSISFSEDKKYFIDTYSSPATPPSYELRNSKGKLIKTLKKVDAESGWIMPEEFTVRSANDKWDLYGLMFKPADFDATKSYPIVVSIYPGPQVGSIGSWRFRAGGRNAALASLGFVVVQLNGSCTPFRTKDFHDACYGNMAENTLPDHIAALEQLAQTRPFMDINRVGIYGHSGGGFATAAALFNYPEFFKVGVSSSGNHDNRNYEDDWGERYNGLESEVDYAAQANQVNAKNLEGKLLIMHGGMDDNVPPYNTYLVVDALIKANKDFDLIIYPNARHGYGMDSLYQIRRTWDYFVKHLRGEVPPKEYKLSW
ncbi:MAG: DPP IV N-terminal domain-containing protein [Flavobacteriaceae bacterium]